MMILLIVYSLTFNGIQSIKGSKYTNPNSYLTWSRRYVWDFDR